MALVVLSASACSNPAPTTAPQPAPWAHVLTTATTLDAFAVPAGVAQVELRLPGELPAPDTLVAEVSAQSAPDEAKRWPVDAATAAADGVRVSVTLPVYALTPDDYVVTVWQGDADALQRYAFRVLR
ncbi:MAG: hypothetical protein ABI880_07705 [Acidobacteriota bacterium]